MYVDVLTRCETFTSNSSLGDGVDGQWSTFALRIGTPAQNVRVIISTNSPETLVVLPPGCTTVAIKPVPDNCANARGGLFNLNSSSTWLDKGFFGINKDGVGLEANLGYSLDADYGLETVGLGFVGGGSNAPTLENQTVAGFGTKSPFYMYGYTLEINMKEWLLTYLVAPLDWEPSLSITLPLGISLLHLTFRC